MTVLLSPTATIDVTALAAAFPLGAPTRTAQPLLWIPLPKIATPPQRRRNARQSTVLPPPARETAPPAPCRGTKRLTTTTPGANPNRSPGPVPGDETIDHEDPVHLAGCRFSVEREKGDRLHLCEAPCGPSRQMVSVPFFRAPDAKRGQAPFVRSTLRAVPANGACPLFRARIRWRVPSGIHTSPRRPRPPCVDGESGWEAKSADAPPRPTPPRLSGR